MRMILRTSNRRNYSLIKLTALVWIVGLLIVINACGGNSETEDSSDVINSSDSVLIESGEMPAPEGSQGEFVLVDEMKAARQLHSAIKLPDGRIFVVGGRGPGANLNNTVYETAELYNPDSDEGIVPLIYFTDNIPKLNYLLSKSSRQYHEEIISLTLLAMGYENDKSKIENRVGFFYGHLFPKNKYQQNGNKLILNQ